MFMVLNQYRVTWEAFPDPPAGGSARPSSPGSLVVTRNMNTPDDVTKLVSILLENGYQKITVEGIPSITQAVDDNDGPLSREEMYGARI